VCGFRFKKQAKPEQNGSSRGKRQRPSTSRRELRDTTNPPEKRELPSLRGKIFVVELGIRRKTGVLKKKKELGRKSFVLLKNISGTSQGVGVFRLTKLAFSETEKKRKRRDRGKTKETTGSKIDREKSKFFRSQAVKNS